MDSGWKAPYQTAMMRRMYDWTMRQAASERAPAALGIISFIESSFFPIPPDIMFMPMVIANRAKAWWYASIATVSSVLGGAFGYSIGSTCSKPSASQSSTFTARVKASIHFAMVQRMGRVDHPGQGHDAVPL